MDGRPCPRQGPSTINVFQRVAMPSLVVGCKALKIGVKVIVLILNQTMFVCSVSVPAVYLLFLFLLLIYAIT